MNSKDTFSTVLFIGIMYTAYKHTLRKRSVCPARSLIASATRRPATIAFVEAIAGMMLPAIAV